MTKKKYFNIFVVFHCGVLYGGPHLTLDEDKARALYEGYCKKYGLSPKDAHDGETDIYWWVAEEE